MAALQLQGKVDYLVETLRSCAKNDAESAKSAVWVVYTVVKTACALSFASSSERSYCIWAVFERIAAGPDGVEGTSDDIVDPEAVRAIRTLMVAGDSRVLQELVQMALRTLMPSAHASSPVTVVWIGLAAILIALLWLWLGSRISALDRYTDEL